MRFKIRTIEISKNEFLTKVTKNSEMYYVAGVSLNFTIIIRNLIELTKQRTNEPTKSTKPTKPTERNKPTNQPTDQTNQTNQTNQPTEPTN
jgi:hypothetical protein